MTAARGAAPGRSQPLLAPQAAPCPSWEEELSCPTHSCVPAARAGPEGPKGRTR